jgi:4-amino-4-deoxy-L-arabinose transferase-like glycosyltransferase
LKTKISTTRNHFSLNFQYHPWVWFGFLAFISAIISYVPLSLTGQIGFFFLGFLPVFVLAVLNRQAQIHKRDFSWTLEFLPSFPTWVWLCLIGLAIYLRFFRLDTLSTWPIADEGRTSLFAIYQARNWEWNLLYGFNQLPPFFYWFFALFYKIFQPSLTTLWLFPALLSVAILGLGYWTARIFFSKSYVLITTGLLAFSFWPLYVGRFAAEGLLVLFWELLTLPWLGYFLKARTNRQQRNYGLLLGIFTGLGFYVHLHWPFVAFFLVLTVFWICRRRGTSHGFFSGQFVFFIFPVLLIPFPLLSAVLQSSYGNYMQSITAFQGQQKNIFDYLYNSASYFSSIFWGVNVDYFAYKPFWGGFFNPVLSGIFFLGLIELFVGKSRAWKIWIFSVFFVFFLPAFLTNDLEIFRIIQVLPFLLVITARGIHVLIERLSTPSKTLFLSILLLVTVSLGIYHLLIPYSQWWKNHFEKWSTYAKSEQAWKTYQLLEPLSRAQGPGAILLESGFNLQDQTFFTATYSFNAAVNPSISLKSIHWAVFFCDSLLASRITSQFPGSHYAPLGWAHFDLAASLSWIHSSGVVFVRITDENRNILEPWLVFHKVMQDASFQELNCPRGLPQDAVIKTISSQIHNFHDYPEMQYLMWRKCALLFQKNKNDARELDCLEHAVKTGCADSPYFYRMGVLLVKEHRYSEAKTAFLKAGRLNPDMMPPSVIFERLSREGKLKDINKSAD